MASFCGLFATKRTTYHQYLHLNKIGKQCAQMEFLSWNGIALASFSQPASNEPPQYLTQKFTRNVAFFGVWRMTLTEADISLANIFKKSDNII
jgi:hypothetical protein